eukprot:SAG25_NODE_953_length_4593_cov_6.284824_2_plen_404_part_00
MGGPAYSLAGAGALPIVCWVMSAGAPQRIRVLCPPSLPPSRLVVARAPDGGEYEVLVPASVQPGQRFIAEVEAGPADDGWDRRAPRSGRRSSALPSALLVEQAERLHGHAAAARRKLEARQRQARRDAAGLRKVGRQRGGGGGGADPEEAGERLHAVHAAMVAGREESQARHEKEQRELASRTRLRITNSDNTALFKRTVEKKAEAARALEAKRAAQEVEELSRSRKTESKRPAAERRSWQQFAEAQAKHVADRRQRLQEKKQDLAREVGMSCPFQPQLNLGGPSKLSKAEQLDRLCKPRRRQTVHPANRSTGVQKASGASDTDGLAPSINAQITQQVWLAALRVPTDAAGGGADQEEIEIDVGWREQRAREVEVRSLFLSLPQVGQLTWIPSPISRVLVEAG